MRLVLFDFQTASDLVENQPKSLSSLNNLSGDVWLSPEADKSFHTLLNEPNQTKYTNTPVIL